MAGLAPAIYVSGYSLCREDVDARDIGVRKHAVLRTAKRGHDVRNLEMSPDLYFALTLIVKMAVTAAFLLAATITCRTRRAADRRSGCDASDQRRPGLHLSGARS
jgi:hypothetical protein